MRVTLFLTHTHTPVPVPAKVYFVDGDSYSQCRFNEDDYNKTLYTICFFLSSYVIPLTIVFILYVLMLKRLWFGAVPGGHMSTESVRSKKRVTRMVVIVVVIFAVCWCPIQIVLVLKAYDAYDMSTVRLITQIVGHVLAYMNSCVNPILYAFLSENFRKAFNKVIACHSTTRGQAPLRREETHAAAEITMASCTSRTTKLTNGNV